MASQAKAISGLFSEAGLQGANSVYSIDELSRQWHFQRGVLYITDRLQATIKHFWHAFNSFLYVKAKSKPLGHPPMFLNCIKTMQGAQNVLEGMEKILPFLLSLQFSSVSPAIISVDQLHAI